MKIRPLQKDDKVFLFECTNNQELWGFILKNHFVNEIEHEKFFDDLAFDKTKEYFIIESKEYRIGVCGFRNIDLLNSKAELFVFISDISYRGKGIGDQAVKFLINYAFRFLSLNKIYLRVAKDNNAKKLYEKNGFEIEGLLKEDFKISDSYKDVYIMSLFNESHTKDKI